MNNYAKIDYDKCTGCGACTSQCPTGCLKLISDVAAPVPAEV